MRLLLSVFVAILFSPSTAQSADFSVELLKPVNGLRQCQVMFTQVPPKPKVDAVMNSALDICTMIDNSRDVQVMAFKGDDTLDDTQETYTYLVYEHRTRTIKHVTFDQFLKGLKPIK